MTLAPSSPVRSINWPWRDRTGAFSVLRALALVMALTPALALLVRFLSGDLAPRPLTEATLFTGLWAVRLLAVTLCVTPAMALLRYPRLVAMRRILGLAAFFWTLGHVALFIADKSFDLAVVLTEIARRFYLLIGFVAFFGLFLLAATSSDRALARLGVTRWRRLHRLVYGVALLALIHFFLQAKLDKTAPSEMAALFFLLAALRLPRARGETLTPLFTLLAGVLVSFIVAFAEAFWFSWKTGADVWDILAMNFDFSERLRPAFWPVIASIVFAFLAPLGRFLREQSARKLRANNA